MSNPVQEAFWLMQNHADNGFLTSLYSQYRRKNQLSPKQWACVRANMDRQVKPATIAPARVHVGNVHALFDQAGSHLKHPKVTLFDQLGEGGNVVLRKAGPNSKYHGQITVTDGERYPDNRWFGAVTREGNWTPPHSLPKAEREEIEGILRRFSDDPAGIAAVHGQRTGSCCFCARELTDERSVSVGYGPICADHWGLPWG